MKQRYHSPMAFLIVTVFALLDIAPALAQEWSDPISIYRRREGTVLSYRAKFDSGYLIVEAKHGEGWHTYTMDNVQRAQKKSGKEKPETELPTVITIDDGITTAGPWHQSIPKNLTMKEINWYTWGFENTAYFAIKAEKIAGSTATITISAQACNATSCSMVDGEKITVALPQSLPESILDSPPDTGIPYQKIGDPEIIEKL